MGASASTDIATRFFEESKSVPCHLDLNLKPPLRVADEGVKLMPGGALVVKTIECPLHQVGDGKGVSGQLRTVDSPIPKPAESNKLRANNRLISQRLKLLKEKTSVMSTEDQSEFPGNVPPAVDPRDEDVKPIIVIEEDRQHHDFFQSETKFSPDTTPLGNAKLISSEFPMKHHNLPQAGEPGSLSQISGIPPNINQSGMPVVDHASYTHQFSSSESTMKQKQERRLLNQKTGADNKMMSPIQKPNAEQSSPLGVDRLMPNIPKTATDEFWGSPARQMFWNAALRKGWRWDKTEMSAQEMDNIISVYSSNNQLAWREVLKWEALHSDECTEPKLKKFSIFSTKYSLRARLRSWLGYELPFDRHDWIVDRNGKEIRYIIDYYDGGKMNTNFEFALLDVRPALDSFEAIKDRIKVAWNRWTSSSQEVITPATNPVPELSRLAEPLNFSRRSVNDSADKFQEARPSRFMPYSLSDIEKERDRKNSVS